MAKEGWRLHQAGEFSGRFKDGRYTDPDSGKFWSNGRWARLDPRGNGHAEVSYVYFDVVDAQLCYVGVQRGATFAHVGTGYEEYLGHRCSEFTRKKEENPVARKFHGFLEGDKWARGDSEGDGHHETIMQVIDGKYVYVGKVDEKGRITEVGEGYEKHKGLPVRDFELYLNLAKQAEDYIHRQVRKEQRAAGSAEQNWGPFVKDIEELTWKAFEQLPNKVFVLQAEVKRRGSDKALIWLATRRLDRRYYHMVGLTSGKKGSDEWKTFYKEAGHETQEAWQHPRRVRR